MPFTFLNDPETGAPQDQIEPDARDFEIRLAGFLRTGVASGCAVTEQAVPDQSVLIAAGTVFIANQRVAVSGGSVSLSAADGTNPRIDLITVNTSGTKAAVDGTASADPVYPTIPASRVVLAAVFRAANDNTIQTADITDKRVMVRDSPQTLSTLYVSKQGNDTWDGLTWATAKLTVGAAITVLGGETTPRGTVHIGPGVFVESNLPWGEDLHIVGSGWGNNVSTTLQTPNAANNSIFRLATGYSTPHFAHGASIRNIRLNGNRANQTTGGHCLDLTNISGGFGMAFYDVLFVGAFNYGVKHVGNCLDIYFYNCTFRQCNDGAVYSEMAAGAGYTWAMFGTQVDDCGNSATKPVFEFKDNTTSYDLRQVHLHDTKVENGVTSDGVGDRIVQLSSAAVQAKGFHVIIDGMNSMRLDAAAMGTAIVYETVGDASAQESRVSLRNVMGRRTNAVFKSDKTSVTITGYPLRGSNNPATDDTNGRQIYYAQTGPTWVHNFMDITSITAPANPAFSGQHRFYVDSADAIFKSRDSAGKISVYGSRVRALFIDGSYMRLDAASGTKLGAPPNAVDGALLKDGETSGAYANFILPVDVLTADTITVRPVWVPIATDATPHTVQWQMNIRKITGVDVTAAGTTVAWTGDSAARTANVEVTEAGQVSTAVTFVANDRVRLEIQRDGAHANDSYVGDLALIGVLIQYTANN